MLLYEKNLQHLDYLFEVNFFLLTSKNYGMENKL
jgi:hypothetical protein